MNVQQVALVTIGQSPRHDMSAAIEDALSGKAVVTHAGVLDGLDEGEIKRRFKVPPGISPLITKLANGGTYQLEPHKVEAGLQAKIAQLERGGAGIIVILCTGCFHTLHARSALLVEPDMVIPAMVAALVREKTLGVIVPLPAQMDECAGKWRQSGTKALFDTASPYADSAGLVQAAKRLCERGADLIVLDCMGYTQRHKQSITDTVDIPVIVSSQVVAATLTTLI